MYPTGKAAVAVTARRSIGHFLQVKTWMAVSAVRSYTWVGAAGVLGVAAPAEIGDDLLWSHHCCSSPSVSSTPGSPACQLL